jgi:cyclopropane fatty-acyl-phospholipid synthase-like methyltransferase
MVSSEFFDSIYVRHKDYYGTAVRPEFERFLAALPGNPPVCLDIGSGQGRHALIAAKAGIAVHALDYSDVAMRQLRGIAEAEGLPITVECGDAGTMALPPGAYDAVIMISLLSHLGGAAIPRLVERAFETLRPGGRVFVEAFTVDDPGYRRDSVKSETSDALRTYFRHGELKALFSPFAIHEYREFVEDDFAHGPAHQHGVALLIGERPSS